METNDIIAELEKNGILAEIEKDGIRIMFIYYEIKINYDKIFKCYISENKAVELYEFEEYKEYYNKRKNEMKFINNWIKKIKKELDEKYKSAYN